MKYLIATLMLAASLQASGATICTGCDYLDSSAGTYLGLQNPATIDQSTFTNTAIGAGAFTDAWVFDLDPAGKASINAAFSPVGDIDDFTISLHADDGSVCDAGAPGACSSISFNPAAIASDSHDVFADLDFTALTAGRYVFVISGSVSDGQAASYAGNMNTFVPVPVDEPAPISLILTTVLVLLFGGGLWFALQWMLKRRPVK